MLLYNSTMVRLLDNYLINNLGIKEIDLIQRAGQAIASAIIREYKALSTETEIAVLAGSGNNGLDGYAAAIILSSYSKVKIYNILLPRENSESRQFYIEKCKSIGIEIVDLDSTRSDYAPIVNANIIIEGVLGAGARLPYPKCIERLCSAISLSEAYKVAIDIPLGAMADTGEVMEYAPHFDLTQVLSIMKIGLVSYPAREYAGKLLLSNLGIDSEVIELVCTAAGEYIDNEWAKSIFPRRQANTNKGSFGRLMILAGSKEYFGAAKLALEMALRGGAGYVYFYGERELNNRLSTCFPEAIYKVRSSFLNMSEEEIAEIVAESKNMSAVLIGPGATCSAGLAELIYALLSIEGPPIVIDADGINALSIDNERGKKALREAKRPVILTPHPGEYARLTTDSVININSSRIKSATAFASGYPVILVLKGAGTVICDKERVYINSTGSSALAKAGSGDVLAGLIASLIASNSNKSVTDMLALGAYLHGTAGDSIADRYSSLGLTPSDLPKEIAIQMSILEKPNKSK